MDNNETVAVTPGAARQGKPYPARLHCLLARDTADAIVIRRGPSKQTAVFHWDRATDTFTLGQWLKGRIYERRCDISRDGRHWIYFAMNGAWFTPSEGSWTAVARTGWLKALAFYPKGDCWEGGGLFQEHGGYWLNDRWFDPKTATQNPTFREGGPGIPHRDPRAKPDHYYNAECLTPYYNRLQRDGWTRAESRSLLRRVLARFSGARSAVPDLFEDDPNLGTGSGGGRDIFTKPLPAGGLLVKRAHTGLNPPPGRGCYWDDHRVLHADGTWEPHPDWEWADFDPVRERLVWAEKGKIRAVCAPWRIGNGKSSAAVLLRDFNSDRFEARVAPY